MMLRGCCACVNNLFVFDVDNNAQRSVLGGSETDWGAGVGWEVLTEPHPLYGGHESLNGANLIYNCFNEYIFNGKIKIMTVDVFIYIPTGLSNL